MKNRINYQLKMLKFSSVPLKSLLFLFIITIIFACSKVVCANIFEYILNDISESDINTITFKIIYYSALIVLCGISYYLFITIRKNMKQAISSKIQSQITNDSMKSDLMKLEKISGGSWFNTMMDDVDIFSNYVPYIFFEIILGCLQFSIAIGYGLTRSKLLTFIILITSFTSIIIPAKISPIIQKKRLERQELKQNTQDQAIDIMNNIMLLKNFNSTEYIIHRYKECYDVYSKAALDNERINSKLKSLNMGLGSLATVVWIVIGIYLININQISLAVFVSFLTLSPSYKYPFNELSYSLAEGMNSIASYKRITNLLDSLAYVNSTNINFQEIGALTIIGKNISFRYSKSGDSKMIIENLSFNFSMGDKILIEGESGKGKTTLMKIIMGLYRPTHGEVLYQIDGTYYLPSDLYCLCGYIPQRNSLFSGTIRENLLLGNDKASEGELYKVIRDVSLSELVAGFESGLDTMIGGSSGLQLSEGEAQRLAIARCLLKKPEVYFMDEITSALDPENEQNIINLIKKTDKMMVIISHKPKVKNVVTKSIY